MRLLINKAWLFIALPFALVSLLSCTTATTESISYERFDDNGNNLLELDEFRDAFVANYTDDWNYVDNVGLDDEDFYVTTYGLIDRNDDDFIDEREWVYGYDYYYGPYLENKFSLYDLDGNKYLTMPEYQAGIQDTEFFLTWDVDRNDYLSEVELADAVFNSWDENNNGTLERDEFEGFDLYY